MKTTMTMILSCYYLLGIAQIDHVKLDSTVLKKKPIEYYEGQIRENQIDALIKKYAHLPNSRSSSCNVNTPTRSIDGSCNNINNPDWGRANTPLLRQSPSMYGPSNFNNDLGGQGRSNPRKISNLVSNQTSDLLSNRSLSQMVFTSLQFIDHDMSLTPSNKNERSPIFIPDDEKIFSTPIDFNRSIKASGTGINSPREQVNTISSWIDASNVYGSDAHRAGWLRTFRGGKLKTSRGNLLPYNTLSGEFNSPIDRNAPKMDGDDQGKVFVAGDSRANEQPGLTSLHILFMREHNRLCDAYARLGYTDDELIYQVVRKTVGAILQGIVYNELLPALGISLDTYNGYKPYTNGSISNIFSTAAYRLGHTMIDNNLLLLNDQYGFVDFIPLAQAFFNISIVQNNDIDPILMGLASRKQQEIDLFVVDNLRNFLFSPAPGVPGLDLAALNIQRGRDHGLPDYNTIRIRFTNTVALSWDAITSSIELQDRLKKAYGNNLNDIDLWVGLLAEDHLPGKSIGMTLNAVLKSQFQSLRDGDRFYYEADPLFQDAEGFWTDYFTSIRLADIIRMNTNLSNIHNQVFFVNNNLVTDIAVTAKQRLSDSLVTTKAISSTPVEKPDFLFSIYPNPAKTNFTIGMNPEEDTQIIIEVTSLTGERLLQKTAYYPKGYSEQAISIDSLLSGFYLVHLKTADGELLGTKKLLVT